MYRLFHRIHKGLDPVAEQFKAHVENEGNKLVKDVTEEVEAKKEKESGQWAQLCFAICVDSDGIR
jgi:cullin 1